MKEQFIDFECKECNVYFYEEGSVISVLSIVMSEWNNLISSGRMPYPFLVGETKKKKNYL